MTEDEILSLIQLSRQVEWRYKLDMYEAAELRALNDSVVQAEQEIVSYIERRGASLGKYSERKALGLLDETAQLRFGIQAQLAGGVEEIATTAGVQSVLEHNNILSFDGLLPGFREFNLTAEQVRSLVRETPVGGHTLNNWMSKLDDGVLNKIKQEVTTGMLKGEDYRSLRNRLVKGFDFTRREATTLGRTYVQSVNVGAMKSVYQANSDLIKGVRWLATLESGFSKTGRGICLRCAVLDGSEFSLKDHPPCPLHPNCRCLLLPILPTFRELGVDMDEVERNFRPYTIREDVPVGIGRNAQLTVKEVGFHNGDYGSWFRKQSAMFQRNLLGPRRYELYDRGNISWNDLVDTRTGRLRLLSELVSGDFLPYRAMPRGETFGGIVEARMGQLLAETKASIERDERLFAGKAKGKLVQDPWTGEYITTRQLAARKAVRTRKGLTEPPKIATKPQLKPKTPPTAPPKPGLVQDPISGEWITQRQLAARKAVITRQAKKAGIQPKATPTTPPVVEKTPLVEVGTPEWYMKKFSEEYGVELRMTEWNPARRNAFKPMFDAKPTSKWMMLNEDNYKEIMDDLDEFLAWCKRNGHTVPRRIAIDDTLMWRKFKHESWLGGYNSEFDLMYVTTIRNKNQIMAGLREDVITKFGTMEHRHITYAHETGHYAHYRVFERLGLKESELVPYRTYASFSFDETMLVQKEVSRYASASPMEFVAETYGSNILGRQYSDEVWELYRKWNGPDCPGLRKYLGGLTEKKSPDFFINKFANDYGIKLELTDKAEWGFFSSAEGATSKLPYKFIDERNFVGQMEALDDFFANAKANRMPIPKVVTVDHPNHWAAFKKLETYAGYERYGDQLHITTAFSREQYLDWLKADVKGGWSKLNHKYANFGHEIGHKAHGDILEQVFGKKIPGEYRQASAFTSVEKKLINKNIGKYAATNPMEFVAEVYTSDMVGQVKFSDEIWELYHKWNGPDCFGYGAWHATKFPGAPIQRPTVSIAPATKPGFIKPLPPNASYDEVVSYYKKELQEKYGVILETKSRTIVKNNLQGNLELVDDWLWEGKQKGIKPFSKIIVDDKEAMKVYYAGLEKGKGGMVAGYQQWDDSLQLITVRSKAELFKQMEKDFSSRFHPWNDPMTYFAHENSHSAHMQSLWAKYQDLPGAYYKRLVGADYDLTISQVGKYASSNAYEFVAEVHYSNVLGKNYIDKIWELYDSFEGPLCPGYQAWLTKKGWRPAIDILPGESRLLRPGPISGKTPMEILREKELGKTLARKGTTVLPKIEIETELVEAPIRRIRNVNTGANESRKIELDVKTGKSTRLNGLFKPISGEIGGEGSYETILNQGARFSLAHREVAAYEVAKKMNINYVPETVLREVQGELGSLQRWVSKTKPESSWFGRNLNSDEVYQTGVFDFIIGNADRHGRNLLRLENGSPVLIDHGLSFPRATPGFPHGLEEFFCHPLVRETMPQALQRKIRRLDTTVSQKVKDSIKNAIEDDVFWTDLTRRYHMSDGERSALFERLQIARDYVNRDNIGELFYSLNEELWEGLI